MSNDIASTVATAVAAIQRATALVGETDSGIDDAQIRELRDAIDGLELVLNAKKRKLDADRGECEEPRDDAE